MGESSSEQPAQAQKRAHMTPGAWLGTLKASWQTVLYVNRESLTPFQAARSTLGVGIPLVLGLATGQVETGVLVASGALMLGSVGLKDPYQKRARTMLVASLFVAVSALAGGFVGGFGWLPVLLAITLWGFVTGMFASISQVAQIVAIQSCSALIVYTHLTLDPPHALLVACAVGVGTLFQFLLASLPSPWTNTLPERTALSTIYQKLAEGACSQSQQQTLQSAEALLAGHNTLLSGNTRSEKGQMFSRLLEEAEHLRLTLFVLRRQQLALAQQAAEDETLKSASEHLELLFHDSSLILQQIAQALKPLSPTVGTISRARHAETYGVVSELRCLAEHSARGEEIQQILPYCTRLLGELRIALRLATSWRHARQYWPVRIRFSYPRPPHLHLEDIHANVRANLTPRSSAFRHAIRLSVALLLATALYQVFHLSVARGYWIPMTTVLVLRADFTTTFTRGIARLLGTMLGAVLTTLLVVALNPSPELLAALIILAAYLMYATLFANYAIFSLGTTVAVAFLLSFIHAPTVTTALDRAFDTACGGVLALLVYAVWPTWEQAQVPENIAKRLEMLGRYFYALMQEYATPDQPAPQNIEKRHKESRLARSNALGSVQRSLQEPVAHRVDADLAEGLLAAADDLSRCALALEAYLNDHPRLYPCPPALDFAVTVETTLDNLAAAIRAREPARNLPDVPAALQQLKNAARVARQTQPESHQQWKFLLEEARRVTTRLQAIQQLLTTSPFARAG
ncbi:MAG TPA: FUSC family protein [Ktedonobacteraceae bacterium]